MLCYHGTSADNLESIKRDGLRIDCEKLWTPSLNEIYCWGKNYIEGELRYNEEGIYDEEDYRDNLISQAFDSALVALSKAVDCRAIVVIFDVDESELETDNSCDNMDHANSIGRNIKPEEIVEILVSNDLSLLRGYFIGLALNRKLVMVDYDGIETMVGELFQKAKFYPDDLSDILSDILRWDSIQHYQGTLRNEFVLT